MATASPLVRKELNELNGLHELKAHRISTLPQGLLPFHEPRPVGALPTIPPLPFGRGRGEGSVFALEFRRAKGVKMSGVSLLGSGARKRGTNAMVDKG